MILSLVIQDLRRVDEIFDHIELEAPADFPPVELWTNIFINLATTEFNRYWYRVEDGKLLMDKKGIFPWCKYLSAALNNPMYGWKPPPGYYSIHINSRKEAGGNVFMFKGPDRYIGA